MYSLTGRDATPQAILRCDSEALQDFLSAIRSRLNVIGASVYLLQDVLDAGNTAHQRHVNKIMHELEVLREIINS